MAESQVATQETPPMSREDLETLAKNETDDDGLILGKFKSVDDLAASYKELEGKLGQKEETTESETETETEVSTEETTNEKVSGYEEFYTEPKQVTAGTKYKLVSDRVKDYQRLQEDLKEAKEKVG